MTLKDQIQRAKNTCEEALKAYPMIDSLTIRIKDADRSEMFLLAAELEEDVNTLDVSECLCIIKNFRFNGSSTSNATISVISNNNI